MEQRLARKWIPAALNPSEITLTLDQLESSLIGKDLVSIFLRNNVNMKMASRPTCDCGVIRSNRIPHQNTSYPPFGTFEIIHLVDQASAWLSNEMPQHGFHKKCHLKALCVQHSLRSKKQIFIRIRSGAEF